MDMSGVIREMAVMMILIALGYMCGKMKITGQDFNKAASWLAVNVFTSGTIISAALGTDTVATGGEILTVMLWMLVFFIINCVIAWLTPKLMRMKSDAGITAFMIGVMNCVFIGYPVLSIVYGDAGIFYASLSNIPANLVIYSWGVMQLSRDGSGGKAKLDLKQLISAPMISTIVAVTIFITHVQLPKIIGDVAGMLAGATVPLSMVVIGATLSTMPLKETLMDKNTYIVSFVRLIVCPVITWLVMKQFVSDPVVLGTIVILSSTPVAVLSTTMGIQYGCDGNKAARGVFVSTLLSIATMPLIIWMLL